MATYADSRVKCPFYLYEPKNRITCEGIEKGTTNGIYFASEQKRKEYARRYCCQDYRMCLLYQAIEQKYEK